MMKRFASLCYITLSALLMLTACQIDETAEQGGAQHPNGKARVTLRIATDNGKASTRAWQDANAKTDRTEMMYSWIVLITDGSNIIKKFTGTPDDAKAEIDDVCTNVEMASGTYTVYSFANISEADLKTMLSISSLEVGTTLTDATVTAATATVNGNGFVPSETNGIPMSNRQTLTVADEDITKDLIVVRMLAKIEVQVFNDGDSPVTIESISLTDVTPNTANNLKLLPNYGTTPDYPDDMDDHHKDLQPNLNTTSKGNMTYTIISDNEVATTGHKSTGTGQTPVKFTFYVNESIAPDNGSGLFYLTLGIKTGSGEEVVYSHALISQKGKTDADDNAWNYIARNDYRVIPVILTDWLFRIEPIAFVPIAGYPATLLSSDAQKATFSTGGMIALQPFVKKRTDATWRDFDDPEVSLVSIHWKNSVDEGNDPSGSGMTVLTPFTYDPVTKYIIGELNSDKVTSGGTNKTAVTITLKLGPESGDQYTYSFTCDVNI